MLVQRKNFTSRGCFACVSRKVKCDEQKPSCSRCRRKDLQCPGYRHSDDLLFRNSLSLAKSSSSDIQQREATAPIIQNYNGDYGPGLCSIPRLPGSVSTQDGSWHAHESNSLHYFRTLAAQDFQGYLRSEFWSSTIYQKSLHHPAINHALLAVSDAHREWVVDSSINLSSATLMQYGKALRMTAEIQKGKTWETYTLSLYCCILLYYFELLNGNGMAAGVHLESGLRLLREWYSASAEWPPTGLNTTKRTEFFQLLYTIGRLDVDRSLSGTASPHPTKTLRLLRDGLRPVITEGPSAFSLGCLLLLLSLNTLHFTTSNIRLLGTCVSEVPYEVLHRQNLLYQRVDAILVMLEKFQASIDDTSMSGRQKMMAICIMRLYLISNRVRLAGIFTAPSGEILNPYDEHADQMLECAEMAVGLHCTPPLRQGFMPEPGIIAPLTRLACEVSRESLRCRAHVIIDRLSSTESGSTASGTYCGVTTHSIPHHSGLVTTYR